jgi:hypothetical protein
MFKALATGRERASVTASTVGASQARAAAASVLSRSVNEASGSLP